MGRAIQVTDAQREVLAWLVAGPKATSQLASPGNGVRLVGALRGRGLVTVGDEADPVVSITDDGRAVVARYHALATVNDPAVAEVVGRLIDGGRPPRRSSRGVIGKATAGVPRTSPKEGPLPAGAGGMHGNVEAGGEDPTIVRAHGRWRVRRRF